jgi:hypothetical protein
MTIVSSFCNEEASCWYNVVFMCTVHLSDDGQTGRNMLYKYKEFTAFYQFVLFLTV